MTTLCNCEEEIVVAAINGHLDTPLISHLESCESCRAAVAMTSLLRADEPCSDNTTAKVFMPDIIWTRAVYLMRQRQKRIRKLGLAVGAAFGILAGYLTGVVAMPANSAISLSQAASMLSHSLPALCPAALIILAVVFVFFANPVTGSVARYR